MGLYLRLLVSVVVVQLAHNDCCGPGSVSSKLLKKEVDKDEIDLLPTMMALTTLDPSRQCALNDEKCIRLCCPAGQVRMSDPYFSPDRCNPDQMPQKVCAPAEADPGGSSSWLVNQRASHQINVNFDNIIINGQNYSLLSSHSKFKCEAKYSLIRAEDLYSNHSLTGGGELLGAYPINDTMIVESHSRSMFCLAFNKENSSSEINYLFNVCTRDFQIGDVDETNMKFTLIFYPTALLISSLFLLLTIISYILDSDLHRPLFGKITLGFVVNLLFSYLCLAAGYISRNFSSGLSLMSGPCLFLGYITLYSFFSFMFWINAMAASICFKFSAVLSASTENESRKFLINFLYAQGTPLLLCICVYIVDRFGPCHWTLPNMGVAQCFVGTPWMEIDAGVRYFHTSEFIYFQSILLVLQIINIIYFLVTVYFLMDHWKKASALTKTGENRGNFLIVVKLFFIMGIPWLGELLSHTITHEKGPAASFNYRIAIDCLNLFTGVLVFLVLVCKKKTVRRVRSRIQHTSQLSRGSTLTTSAKDTVGWSRGKDNWYSYPGSQKNQYGCKDKEHHLDLHLLSKPSQARKRSKQNPVSYDVTTIAEVSVEATSDIGDEYL